MNKIKFIDFLNSAHVSMLGEIVRSNERLQKSMAETDRAQLPQIKESKNTSSSDITAMMKL
jgi:hypothetical protein